MTRDLLERCRHRIANDCMAGNVDGYRLIAEIDAALAEPKAEGAHTAGPWLEGCDYGSYQTEIDVTGRAIATVWTKQRVGVLTDEKGIEGDPEGIANLHLILAAPDMLAALERCVETMPKSAARDEADAVIAKAKGGGA